MVATRIIAEILQATEACVRTTTLLVLPANHHVAKPKLFTCIHGFELFGHVFVRPRTHVQ